MTMAEKHKEIIKMYLAGVKTKEIAKQLNTSGQVIYYAVNKAGVPKRNKCKLKQPPTAPTKPDYSNAPWFQKAQERYFNATPKNTYQPAKSVFIDNICKGRGYAV